jgi:hypothetical protein
MVSFPLLVHISGDEMELASFLVESRYHWKEEQCLKIQGWLDRFVRFAVSARLDGKEGQLFSAMQVNSGRS